jgi:hypothetical protein
LDTIAIEIFAKLDNLRPPLNNHYSIAPDSIRSRNISLIPDLPKPGLAELLSRADRESIKLMALIRIHSHFYFRISTPALSQQIFNTTRVTHHHFPSPNLNTNFTTPHHYFYFHFNYLHISTTLLKTSQPLYLYFTLYDLHILLFVNILLLLIYF